jgi:hypothetical protein
MDSSWLINNPVLAKPNLFLRLIAQQKVNFPSKCAIL